MPDPTSRNTDFAVFLRNRRATFFTAGLLPGRDLPTAFMVSDTIDLLLNTVPPLVAAEKPAVITALVAIVAKFSPALTSDMTLSAVLMPTLIKVLAPGRAAVNAPPTAPMATALPNPSESDFPSRALHIIFEAAPTNPPIIAPQTTFQSCPPSSARITGLLPQ